MTIGRFSMLGAAMVLAVVPIGQADAAVPIGEALLVRGTVEVQRAEGATASLQKADKILLGDVISTSPKSYVIIGFLDGAKLTVRPDSTLAIDQYSAEGSDLNLLKGGLRAITGAFGHNDPDSFRIQTPVATLGIRGTEFDVRMCEEVDCAAENELHQDKVTLHNEDCPVELESVGAGVYTATYRGATYFIQDDEVTLELGEEEAGLLQEGEATCLKEVPAFLLHDPTPRPGGFGVAVPAIGTGAGGGVAPPPPPPVIIPPVPSSSSLPPSKPPPPPKPISPN